MEELKTQEGAVRVTVTSFDASGVIPVGGVKYYELDCWRAQLVIGAGQQPTTTFQFFNITRRDLLLGDVALPGTISDTHHRVTFGGLVVNGLPVNLNQRFAIRNIGPAASQAFGYLVKEYYVPNFPNPDRS